MSNELTDVRCPCGAEFQADSYDAGFIAGSGMCQNCGAALPPKDICTCPSGDGSLRWPCPKHPAVEQAGTNVGHGHVFPRADGVKMRCGGPGLCSECAADAYRARAALAQPSPVQELDFSKPLETENGDPVKWICADVIEYKSARICVAQDTGLVYSSPYIGLKIRNVIPEQAEAERPEVVAWRYGFSGGIVSDKACLDEWKSGGEYQSLMTVAQHERIVGALRARLQAAEDRADTLEHRMMGMMTRHFAEAWRNRDTQRALDGYLSAGIAQLEQERDAALARVAELEKQEPVATVAKVPGEDWNSLDFHRELQDMHPGTKLYAAPVAQAQPEETPGEILAAKLIETWVTKHGKPAPWSTAVEITALATNMPNDERDRLLALDDDVDAQAQHRVPEELRAICMLVAETGIKYGRGRHRAVASDECRAVVNAVLNADLSVGRACEYAGCCDKAHPGTSLCIAHHSKKAREQLLAAAPGKEGV